MPGTKFALSARLKIGRAEEHLKTLDDEIEAWVQSDPCAVCKECSADGTCYTFSIEIKKPPPLDRWSLIAGDCAHNLRSSLNNLLYALAIRDTGMDPPEKADKLQFPIASTPGLFEKQKYRISTLSAATQAAIERVQPYNRPHPELPPLMSLVRDFNNLDKHRLLNVVAANIQQGHISYEYIGRGKPRVDLGYNLGAVETGTQIAHLMVTPPQPRAECKYEGSVVISIEHAAGPSGRTLGELAYIMKMITDEVKTVTEEVIG